MKKATAPGVLTFQGRSGSDGNEDAVSKRRDGPTMANSGQVAAAGEAAGTKADRSTACDQCHFVCRSQWLPVANVAERVSLLEHGLRHFLEVAAGRGLARHSRCAPRALPPGGRQESDADGSDYRQPVDSHCRGGRRTGLRCWEKDHRTQTASGSRYLGTGAHSSGSWGLLAGPRWSGSGPDKTSGEVWSTEGSLRGFRLRSQRIAPVDPRDARLRAANGAAARGCERLCDPAQTLDHRTDLCLVGTLSEKQQRL